MTTRRPPDTGWSTRTPPASRPTAGGVEQPLGTERTDDDPPPVARKDPDEHEVGDPDREDDRREVPNSDFDDP